MRLLRIRGLSAHAGEHPLLSDVDLDLAAGEVTAVLGESGSGKTTLGLAARGEHRSGVRLRGSVRLRGRELLGGERGTAAPVGYLPQHPGSALNPVRRVGSVLDELAAAAHPDRAGRDAAITAALAEARLLDRALLRRHPHRLSGGQQQRVALAQALVTRPDLLVLDEPATGLDAVTKAEIAGTLSRLSRTGPAILLLTHDLALARALADRIVVLHAGRIVEHGSADRVLTEPDHPRTHQLLAAESRRPGPRRRTAGGGPVLSARGLAKEGRLEAVDLDVPPGRCVAVAGRSGAGKTTLARCLTGLTRPDRGRVWLDGTPLAADIRRRARPQRTRVQYVHQDARASFDEFRPVLAQVARSARGLGGAGARDAARRALSALGLDEGAVSRRPEGLSGGQLQRAALARALLARPAVLVCDEITSGQDVVTRSGLLDVLADTVLPTGTGVVLISHDLAALASIADEVLVLDAGRCVERGPAHEVLDRPRSELARALLHGPMAGDGA